MAVRKTAPTSTKGRKLADTGKSGGTLTRERIASDLEAFRKAGGRIEVLGNTPMLTKVDAPEAAPAAAKKKKAA
ncbi:hypothetical protein [Pseudoxanthomonas suwonensis]|jgi:hypothetical protein|uniref:hypothetical protein n=1 Tax=Pseudoxanthomonas suwonensis TaxID=314722 RepID=UPI00138EF3A5|nr:hypothetical protein [Pseudoxanthomonas suwonensis]KAF1699286.1 hypothetical protein CSC68_15055 [Pseudoxanthomonas suwonensis]